MMLTYRKSREAISMNILKSLLTLTQKIPSFFDYVSELPAPFYLYANFHEWIPPFIKYYKDEMQRYCYALADYQRTLKVVENIYPWYIKQFNKKLDLKEKKELLIKEL